MKKNYLILATVTAILGAALPVSVAHADQSVVFSEDFSQFTASTCPKYVDGDSFGKWNVVYTGFGCVRIANVGGNNVLEIQPQSVSNPVDTSAPLVTGPELSGSFIFKGSVSTLRQLRQNSPPNPWETSWIVWNYTDDDHFYYFIPKSNGWELGKKDPAYPGSQRFLATGNTPTYSLSEVKNFEIHQKDNTITVYINGDKIVEFTDNERPYTSGKIAIYSEDAAITADNIEVLQEVTQPIVPLASNTIPNATPLAQNNQQVQSDGLQLAETGDNVSAIIVGSLIITLMGVAYLSRR